jgi:GxxExxY protein
VKQEAGKSGRFFDCSSAVIGACIEVHRHLGPGLLESIYEDCLCHELSLRDLSFRRQVPLNGVYKGLPLECGYRADLIVEEQLLVELKAVEQLNPVHQAQVITYLRLTNLPAALLVNFGEQSVRKGLRRLTNKLPAFPASCEPGFTPPNLR